MKKVTLWIPDSHGDIISVTLVGGAGTPTMNVNTSAFAVKSVNEITFISDGNKIIDTITN